MDEMSAIADHREEEGLAPALLLHGRLQPRTNLGVRGQQEVHHSALVVAQHRLAGVRQMHLDPEGIYYMYIQGNTGSLKKNRNLFDLEYLKEDSIKLIVILICYSVLLYNSIKPNFRFLRQL